MFRATHLVGRIAGSVLAVGAALALGMVPAAPPEGPVVAAPPAGPVAAAPGTAGMFNMWQDDGYKGQHYSRKSYDMNLHNDSCPGCDPGPGGNFGDDMSSFSNNTPYWWYLYTDKGTNGDLFCVRPYSRDADLGNNGYKNLEDEISSLITWRDTGSNPPGTITCKKIIGHR